MKAREGTGQEDKTGVRSAGRFRVLTWRCDDLNAGTLAELMTVPGVGPVTAVRFVAAVDRIGRLPTAARLAAYLGLIPGERTTGFRTKRTHLTYAVAPQVRWALGRRRGPSSPPARGFAGLLGEQ